MSRNWLTVLLLGCVACADAAQETSREAGVPGQASAAAAPAPAGQEPLYVDVRTPEEFASGHVAGAINIPLDQMETRWQELAAHRDRPVALYCKSGRRSGQALAMLQEQGFSQARNAGGFDQLVAQGVPTGE